MKILTPVNELQYLNLKTMRDRFVLTLDNLAEENVDPIIITAQREAIASVVEEIDAATKTYEERHETK